MWGTNVSAIKNLKIKWETDYMTQQNIKCMEGLDKNHEELWKLSKKQNKKW